MCFWIQVWCEGAAGTVPCHLPWRVSLLLPSHTPHAARSHKPPCSSLPTAATHLPQLAAKQGEGFSVADVRCGTERDGPRRNLHYHVLLCKASSA